MLWSHKSRYLSVGEEDLHWYYSTSGVSTVFMIVLSAPYPTTIPAQLGPGDLDPRIDVTSTLTDSGFLNLFTGSSILYGSLVVP